MSSRNYKAWFMIFHIPVLVHPQDSVFTSERSSSWSFSTVWTCSELESDSSAVEFCSSTSSSNVAVTSSWLPLVTSPTSSDYFSFLAELPLIRWTLFRFSNQFAQFWWCAFNRLLLNSNCFLSLMNTSTSTTLLVTWHLGGPAAHKLVFFLDGLLVLQQHFGSDPGFKENHSMCVHDENTFAEAEFSS